MVPPGSSMDLPAVDDRDREVLRAFSDDSAATLAFQGIRRSLNLHPEKLSRALRRLEEAGAVLRTKDGYRLTEAGVAVVPQPARAFSERLTVMDTMVPATATADVVVEQLKLKWFANLRWVGFTRDRDLVALRWVTDDGARRLTATLDGGRLMIDVEGDLSGGIEDALSGAQSIFAHIARASARPASVAEVPAWTPGPSKQT